MFSTLFQICSEINHFSKHKPFGQILSKMVYIHTYLLPLNNSFVTQNTHILCRCKSHHSHAQSVHWYTQTVQR